MQYKTRNIAYIAAIDHHSHDTGDILLGGNKSDLNKLPLRGEV